MKWTQGDNEVVAACLTPVSVWRESSKKKKTSDYEGYDDHYEDYKHSEFISFQKFKFQKKKCRRERTLGLDLEKCGAWPQNQAGNH